MNHFIIALGFFATIAAGVNAQQPSLRIQPTSVAPRRVAPSLVTAAPVRFAPLQLTDSTRQPTYWQKGLLIGAATGVALGMMAGLSNLGEPSTSTSEKISNSFLLSGVLGMPLGVIGGLIGNSFRKPVQQTSSP